MKDKYKLLFDQYNFPLEYWKRGRGELICRSGRELFALSKTRLSSQRIALEYEWKQKVKAAGFSYIDQYVPDKEEQFIIYDRYYEPFVLRKIFIGSECSIHSPGDLFLAAKNLGAFHKSTQALSPMDQSFKKGCHLISNYQKKKKELVSIEKHIHLRKNKGPFEYGFMELYPENSASADVSISLLEQLPKQRHGWCHGNYNHHNVFFGKSYISTVHFEHFYFGISLLDLYYFIKKAMEKNNYDFVLCRQMLEGYVCEIPLSHDDHRLLYGLFLFPERFWKISNQYMNHKKHWVSPRYIHKLEDVFMSVKMRQNFLEEYRNFYNVF